MIKVDGVELDTHEALDLQRAMIAGIMVCMMESNTSEDDATILIGASAVLRRTIEWVETWHADAWAKATNTAYQKIVGKERSHGGSGGR